MDKDYSQLTPKQDRLWNIVFTFLALLSILALFVIFPSCSAEKRLAGIGIKHPEALEKVCAIQHPVKEVTTTHTEYLPGKTEILPGTVQYVDCDSVIQQSKSGVRTIVQTKRVSVPCPPSTHRVDTFTQTVTKTVENTAKVDYLTKELVKSQASDDQHIKGRNKWRLTALGAIGIILAFTVLKFLFKVKFL